MSCRDVLSILEDEFRSYLACDLVKSSPNHDNIGYLKFESPDGYTICMVVLLGNMLLSKTPCDDTMYHPN
jgi:hypothetical protein